MCNRCAEMWAADKALELTEEIIALFGSRNLMDEAYAQLTSNLLCVSFQAAKGKSGIDRAHASLTRALELSSGKIETKGIYRARVSLQALSMELPPRGKSV